MPEKSLKKTLFFTYFTIILISILIIFVLSVFIFRAFFIEYNISDLRERLSVIKGFTKSDDVFTKNQKSFISKFRKGNTRLTIIKLDGKVVFDSEENPALMENHRDRPEIIGIRQKARSPLEKKYSSGVLGDLSPKPSADKNEVQGAEPLNSTSIRYSKTLKKDMLYLADFIKLDHQIYIIRIAKPLTLLNTQINQFALNFFFITIVLIFIAGIIILIVTKRINKPLEATISRLEKLSQSGLDIKIPLTEIKELNRVIKILNKMNLEIHERIKTIVHEQQEKELILNNMKEGVITIDFEEKITLINKAAKKLLGINDEIPLFLPEIIRSIDLHSMVKQSLQSEYQSKKEIFLNQKNLFLWFSVSTLIDTDNKIQGVLIVFSDITPVKQIEIREKAFSANVSHELKTPLTVLKGFVETLEKEDIKDKKHLKQVYGILLKHVNRLELIINDILTLAEIEEQKEIEVEEVFLFNFFQDICQLLEPKIQQKKIKIVLKIPKDLKIKFNSFLMEQAMVNILDNAIKYSSEKSKIECFTEIQDKQIIIKIQDFGQGISKEHLPFIFERFYRVDKARSRALGGTGLGLAIVKHIIDLHKGKIEVESSLNKGTIFVIKFFN